MVVTCRRTMVFLQRLDKISVPHGISIPEPSGQTALNGELSLWLYS